MYVRQSISILVCAVIALCPVFCGAEATIQLCAPSELADATTSAHAADTPHGPHDHDSDGDHAPHGGHTCICTGGAVTSPVLQIPALAPLSAIFTQLPALAHLTGANIDRWSLDDPLGASSRQASAHAPLLI